MKKIIISLALVSLAIAGNARTTGGNNLVKNGSFDAPGLVQETPAEWTWDPMNQCKMIKTLPDWTVSGQDVWQGGAMVITDESEMGDGDTRPEEDVTFLKFFTDTDNMWGGINIAQIVDGLTAGTDYDLSFAVMGKWVVFDNGKTVDPIWGYRICEVDGDKAGKEIKKVDLGSLEQWWETKTDSFKATGTKVWLEFFFGGWNEQLNTNDKRDQGWMGLDCVDLYDPNGTSGVAELEVADTEAPAEYFNLQGVRVAEPVAGGLYIRRQGAKAAKVVF